MKPKYFYFPFSGICLSILLFLSLLAGKISAKEIVPPIYRVMYGGTAPVSAKNWTNKWASMSYDDSVISDALTSTDSAIPWYPKGYSGRIVRAGSSPRLIYTDDGKSFQTLGSDSVAGLFTHLRWNPSASINAGFRKILFELDLHVDDNGYWEYLVYYNINTKHLMVERAYCDQNGTWGSTTDSTLFMRNRTDGVDDTTFSDFDTSLVQNGWVGAEMKFLKASGGARVQLRLADRQLFTDTTHGALDSGYTIPYGGASVVVNYVRLWGSYLGDLGDALAIGQCKAADSSYQFAHNRFFTLQRAVDSLGNAIPADTTTEPSIVDILYAPPGNTSSVTLSKSSTLSSSYSTENSLSSSLSIGVGVDVEPEALTGECGLEAEASVSISKSLNTGSSVDGSVMTSQEWTLSRGSPDHVIYDMLRLRGFVLRHPRLDKLLDAGNIPDTDFVAYRIVVPDPQKSLQCVPVADFVSTYGKDSVAMAHLDSIYVKNRATGVVNTAHPLISGQPKFVHYIGGTSAASSGTVDVTTSKTLTESYTLGVGAAASLKLIAGSFAVSISSSLDVSHTVGKSSSATTGQGVTYGVSDNVPWDEFNYKYWIDPVYGNIVFEWDSSATYNGGYPSYSSAPWDGHSRKAADLRYSYRFASQSSSFNAPVICTLFVTNATQYHPRSSSSALMPWINNAIGVKESGKGYDYAVSSDRTSAIKVDSLSTDTLLLTLTPPTNLLFDSITLVVPYGYQSTNFVRVDDDTLTIKLPANHASAIEGKNPFRSTSKFLDLVANPTLPDRAREAGTAELGLAPQEEGRAQSVSLIMPEVGSISVNIFDLLGNPVISWNGIVDAGTFSGLPEDDDGRRIAICERPTGEPSRRGSIFGRSR